MAIETRSDLFLRMLKDVLCVERKVLASLPKIERNATDLALKAALFRPRTRARAMSNGWNRCSTASASDRAG